MSLPRPWHTLRWCIKKVYLNNFLLVHIFHLHFYLWLWAWSTSPWSRSCWSWARSSCPPCFYSGGRWCRWVSGLENTRYCPHPATKYHQKLFKTEWRLTITGWRSTPYMSSHLTFSKYLFSAWDGTSPTSLECASSILCSVSSPWLARKRNSET